MRPLLGATAAAAAVAAAAAAAAGSPLAWSVPPFDPAQPLAGIAPLAGVATSVLFWGTPEAGGYNHGAMLHYHGGLLHVAWKNGVSEQGEDKTGQRVRIAQSADGVTWSGAAVLFPSLNTSAQPVALFAGPFAVLNGRLYASATPAVIATGDAQGSQFCLWPDGVDPRNAGPPGQPQPVGTLLLRRVRGAGDFGPVFWARDTVPAGFGPASAAAGILTLNETDAETAGDVASLSPAMPSLPCGDPATAGTNKCEAVLHGSQSYASLPRDAGIANERSHWVVPPGHPTLAGADVLVYRTHSGSLLASVRPPGGAWGAAAASPLPNDDSNINAGTLPAGCGGAAFLAANAVPLRQRNPLTLALAPDGLNFTAVRWLLDCHALAPNSTCVARGPGGSSGGPSYPQALAVTAPAPAPLRGFYVVATNNKEDVVIARVPLEDVARAAGATCGGGV